MCVNKGMHRLLAVVLLALPAAYAQSASVEGSVIDRVTGAGIEGVQIVLFTRQAVRYETASGPAGTFRVSSMRPGTYEARVEENGYRVFRTDPGQVTLAAGQTARMSIEMTRLVSLHGRVTTADGAPAAGVTVNTSLLPSAKTDDAGEFVIEGADPGSYSIRAVPPVSPAQAGERTAPIPTYYNGGQRIVVRGDADVTGLDIRLESAPVYRVRGMVFDQTARPLAGATVQLLSIVRRNGDNLFYPETSTRSAEDGAFEFPAVPSGAWQITASITGNIDLPEFRTTIRWGSAPVSVGRGDVEGVPVRMAAPFSLTGTVDAGGAPLPRVLIRLAGADGRQSFGPLPTTVAADGSFRIDDVLAGRYLVAPSAGPGYYVKTVMLGGTDTTDRPVDLFPGSPPLRIVFARAQGTVRGRVSNPGVTTVILVSRLPNGLGRGGYAQCRPDGTFELTGLAPGEYYAAAFDRLDPRIYSDPVLTERIVTTGTRITVGASQVSVELRASRWPE